MANTVSPAAMTAAMGAAEQIRSLLYVKPNGSGPWGTKGDLMGLLVRLPFHDAITYNPKLLNISGYADIGGSDGCIDLSDSGNNGLEEAINLLEPIRMNHPFQYEDVGNITSPEYLSKADIWVLAGNVMMEEAGSYPLDYHLGRVDVEDCTGHGSRHVDAESKSSVEVAEVFVDRLGFTHREVVSLIGAHVLGKATKSVSGYEGKWVHRNDRFTNKYFVDLIHEPWVKEKLNVPGFGSRTTWHRSVDGTMLLEDEIMLQTDVDLAFQTTGGPSCFRVGGTYRPSSSCPNATHGFAEHVYDFVLDEDAWKKQFVDAWSKLVTMSPAKENFTCVLENCKTPTKRNAESLKGTSSAVSLMNRPPKHFIVGLGTVVACSFLLL